MDARSVPVRRPGPFSVIGEDYERRNVGGMVALSLIYESCAAPAMSVTLERKRPRRCQWSRGGLSGVSHYEGCGVELSRVAFAGLWLKPR